MKKVNYYVIAIVCALLLPCKMFSQIKSSILEKKTEVENSIFDLALSNEKHLHLEDIQKNKLIALSTNLQSLNTKPYFDREEYEAAGLSNTLSEEQFLKLIALKNQKTVAIKTSNNWDNLLRLEYTKGLDSGKAKSEMSDYYSKLMSFQGLKNNMLIVKNNLYVSDAFYQSPKDYYSKTRIDSITNIIEKQSKNMPEALAMLYEIKQGSPARLVMRAKRLIKADRSGEIGYTIAMCDSLKLSNNQLDSLIEAGIQYQNIDNNSKWLQSIPFQSEHLYQILTEEQYLQMTNMKWDTQNTKRVNDAWNELVRRKLVDRSMNEQEVKTNIKIYYQQKQFIMSRYAFVEKERDRRVLVLDKNKPYLLSMLEEARSSSKGNANSGYAW
ncbi:hypothetical protein [Pinibacter soli]|uniref:Uncharacterized protein n=1 Tax=Pinibacter soli TaxID=3044211 RepID=A0ABT6RIX7_9BACT|nr:hypothetical protein [Pinibacter soli]MDI3322525.1 hypothetical protein [Pinibacter soli]